MIQVSRIDPDIAPASNVSGLDHYRCTIHVLKKAEPLRLSLFYTAVCGCQDRSHKGQY